MYVKQNMSALLQALRTGKTTAVRVVEQTIERSVQTKHLNHFAYQNHQQMLENAVQADKRYKNRLNRPLEGITLAFKDNIDTTCSPTTGGCPAFLGHQPKVNSILAQRFFECGIISAGKTNMHELAYGTTSMNKHYGFCKSAPDPERSAGGSSGGAGGCVGVGAVTVSLGTDTGGSIRIPASSNGVCGYKPTINRWNSNYGLKMSHSRDTVGPLTHSVEDISLLDEIVTTQQQLSIDNVRTIRIGIPNENYYEDLDPLVQKVTENAIRKLQNAGFQLIKNDGIKNAAKLNSNAGFETLNYQIFDRLQEYLYLHQIKKSVDEVVSQIASPDVIAIIDQVRKEPVTDEHFYQSYFVHKEILRKEFHSYINRNSLDVFIYPTMPNVPTKFDDIDPKDFTMMHNGKRVSQIFKSIQNTDVASNVNAPCITVPANDGSIGIGLEICTKTGYDLRLIAVAKEIEKVIRS